MCVIAGAAAGAAGAAGAGTASTLSTVAMYASLAMTAMSTIATMQAQQNQGIADMATANYSATMSERDADAAEIRANDAIFRGKLEKQDRALQVEELKAEGRVNYAAGNVVLGSGSVLDWETDVSERHAYDDKMTDYNSKVEAWGEKVKAGDSRAQAQLQRMAGSNKKNSADQASVGTMLGGAAKIGSMAYNYSR